MNTKGLALATFVFGIFAFVLGGFGSNPGFLIGGAILAGSSLVALRMA